MRGYKHIKSFSAAYKRFNRQLVALHEGKIELVKNLAEQSKRDLERKRNLKQLNFYYTN